MPPDAQPRDDEREGPLGRLARKLEGVARLTPAERAALLGLPCTVRDLPARQDIVRFGERPRQCALLLRGWAARYLILADGGRQILSFYVAGDLPDLQSLHLHVMDHSLASLTPCTLAFVPHDAMRDLLARHPGLSAALWRDTLIDAAHYRERIAGIGRRQALGRVAHLFCELYLRQRAVALTEGPRCPMPTKQGELADALGLTSVHVNRVLRALRARGLITLAGGTLTIHDWDGLAEVAEFDPTFLHQADRRPRERAPAAVPAG